MNWTACTIRPSEEDSETQVLTDAGLDRLVADILLLAEMDRILNDECDPDELEMPTGALTVPLSRRMVSERPSRDDINSRG